LQNQTITTKKSKVCFGITNICEDGFFVPFFDYDNIEYKVVFAELFRLQKEFALSDIYIIKSNNGFNALSLDKLAFNELKCLYSKCVNMCNDYKELGLKRGFLTLRIGKDKKLFTIINSIFKNGYTKSKPHAIALSLFYDTKINMSNNNFDNYTCLRFKAYRSAKNGFMGVDKKW